MCLVAGISRSISHVPPTHYTIKIQSFSLLMKNSIERYESRNFEAGGYRWYIFFPNISLLMANAMFILFPIFSCYVLHMSYFCAHRNLVIYPNGNKSRNVKEHLSFYLAMAETNSLSPGWEVYAVFRLFVLDQNQDNFMIVQGNLSSNLTLSTVNTNDKCLSFPFWDLMHQMTCERLYSLIHFNNHVP